MDANLQDNGSPFHSGEQRVQERLGVRDIEQWASKVIRPLLPREHRAFHTSLPFLVGAARDQEGRPWVTLLVGKDGFVTSPNQATLEIGAKPPAGDALEHALGPGSDIGLLGIELATRRRNRVNGRIAESAGDVLVFAVDQSFGNCPQYIREREWRREDGEAAGEPRRSASLSPSQSDWIAGADTFFIASGYRGEGESANFGMDASHRGGDPGFVEILDGTRLRFPDYAGNNHYNTIGNIVADPRIGLLFVDFETGSLLQLTGRASIDWDGEDVAQFPGARRLVAIDIEEVIELPRAVPLRWGESAEPVRSLRLIEKIPESADVTSFVFEARDGGPLPRHEPGQHLPIEFNVLDLAETVRRTYSLSGAPSAERLRISVKREPQGLVSRFLHDQLEPGAIIDTRKPAGDFVLGGSDFPVALVSAGIGLTPMVSILHELAGQDGDRPVHFIHGARDGAHHPLAAEVRALSGKSPSIRTHTAYSRPRPEDRRGDNYDSEGRVDGELLAGLVQDPETHYFLCGPTRFMADILGALEARGVSPDQIHTETFGPVG